MRLQALSFSAATVLAFLLTGFANAGVVPRADAGNLRIVVNAGGDTEVVLLAAPARPQGAKGPVELLAKPLSVMHNGRRLATIKSVALAVDGTGYSQEVAFAVAVGDLDVTFSLESGPAPVPNLVNPWAYASCGMTVTDVNGDGATTTGEFAGDSYQARYNSGAVVWQSLLTGQTAPQLSSQASRDRVPAAGWQQILAEVSDISAGWNFTLTAHDLASGTARFAVSATNPSAGAPISISAASGPDVVTVAGLIPAQALSAPGSRWTLPGPLPLRQGGRLLGTVEKLELVPGVDPNVILNFLVANNGSSAANFTIQSAVLAVGASNPWATASAAITLTDTEGDGATLTGNAAGGHAFEATYNTVGPAVWTGLLGTHNAGGFDTAVAVDRYPASGWEQIPGAVTDMQAKWSFALSAYDIASGSANFAVALAGDAASITATAGTPQQAFIGGAFPEELEATLTDGLGIPIAGVTVTFTAPGAGASGTFPSGNTAVTDGAGKARVPFVANGVSGAYQVTANIASPLTPPATFDLENLLPVPLLNGAGLAALLLLVFMVGALALRRAT